jgi:CelD/BcsL family acetyltransferase involved in cellulose biosynthesis
MDSEFANACPAGSYPGNPQPMITIKRIDALEFESMAAPWNDFVSASTNDNIFLRYEWLMSWWKAFETTDRTFYFLIALDDRQAIVGAFPLQIVERRCGFLFSVKMLQFIGRGAFDEQETEYNTFMMPPTLPGFEQDVYMEMANYIDLHRNEWDIVILGNLLSEHTSTGILENEFKRKFELVRMDQGNNYVIKLSPSYEGFLKAISRNQRRNLLRRSKRVQKDFDARFSIVSQQDEIEGYLESYYVLVRQRHNWVPNPAKEAFLHSLCRNLAAAGWLRCYVLLLDGIPSATIFGFHYNKKYYAYKAAFNPQFFSVSPGTALYAFAIQNEIEQGSEELDYLIGEYAYKEYWSNDVRKIDYIRFNGKSLISRYGIYVLFAAYKFSKARQALPRVLREKLRNKLSRNSVDRAPLEGPEP